MPGCRRGVCSQYALATPLSMIDRALRQLDTDSTLRCQREEVAQNAVA